MGDADPLGTARGARGVDHVGESRGRRAAARVVRRLRREPRAVRVEADDRLACHLGEEPAQRPGGHQRREARVPGDERQALRGIVRIERHVGGAGLQDAEYPLDRLRRAVEAEPDPGFRPHAQPPEVVRQTVRPPVQLAIAQALTLMGHRRCAGVERRLALDELVQAEIRGEP